MWRPTAVWACTTTHAPIRIERLYLRRPLLLGRRGRGRFRRLGEVQLRAHRLDLTVELGRRDAEGGAARLARALVLHLAWRPSFTCLPASKQAHTSTHDQRGPKRDYARSRERVVDRAACLRSPPAASRAGGARTMPRSPPSISSSACTPMGRSQRERSSPGRARAHGIHHTPMGRGTRAYMHTHACSSATPMRARSSLVWYGFGSWFGLVRFGSGAALYAATPSAAGSSTDGLLGLVGTVCAISG